jgi:flagellar biosynthesis/type III secretory pathway protein FliH
MSDTLRDQQEHRLACEQYERTNRINEPSKLTLAWAEEISELMAIIDPDEKLKVWSKDAESIAIFLRDFHERSFELGYEAGLDEGRAGY